MKSRLFTDTQDFDKECGCPPDMICVCIRIDGRFYQELCQRAAARGLSTGQYIMWACRSDSGPEAEWGPCPGWPGNAPHPGRSS